MWVVRLTPAMGILQVTAGVYFTHDPTSAFSLFYLWPCFYAFYFLPRIDAVVDVAFLGLCYGVTMIVMADSDRLGRGRLRDADLPVRRHVRQPRDRRA